MKRVEKVRQTRIKTLIGKYRCRTVAKDRAALLNFIEDYGNIATQTQDLIRFSLIPTSGFGFGYGYGLLPVEVHTVMTR